MKEHKFFYMNHPFVYNYKSKARIMQHYTFKLLLFGDGGVGKTTLVERYVKGTFKADTRITVGVQFLVKRLMVNGNSVDLQIWDFGGEERFRFLLPAYCIGARGGVFMYDIASPGSLLHLGDWMQVVRERTTNFPVLVVGTKSDLDSQRRVKIEEAIAVAGKFNLPDVIETSSKNGQNVNLIFETIAKMMVDDIRQHSTASMNVQIHT
jgi:small GTP-binding protein